MEAKSNTKLQRKNACRILSKVNFKIIILTSTFALILVLLGTTKSSAILQANATTHKNPVSKNGATWITEIRKMETSGQTMGLTETLNGLNATSASNGIDVHMMLPTEYGAVAILSASGYGNPKKLRDETNAQKRTTTGNSTGVYFTGDRWEILSLGSDSSNKYSLSIAVLNNLYNSFPSWHSGTKTRGCPVPSIPDKNLTAPYGPIFGGSGIFSVKILTSHNYYGTANVWTRCKWNICRRGW